MSEQPVLTGTRTGRAWQRIPWQREPFELPFAADEPCPACGAAAGEFHGRVMTAGGQVLMCSLELCPILAPGCSGLYRSCDCDPDTGETYAW